MDLKRVLSSLGIENSADIVSEHWCESEACFPDTIPRLLVPEQITSTREFSWLPSEADGILQAAALRIVASQELLHLAWHCRQVTYGHLDYHSRKLGQWPILTEALGDLSGAFYLLVGLEAIPRMLNVHRSLGVSERVSRDSCSHFPEATDRYREHHGGRFGFLPRALYWLRNHTKGDLYRLGRLEYMVKPFHGKLNAYRHRVTRDVIALAEPGMRLDGDGLAARGVPGEDAWTTTQELDGTVVRGHAISPRGFVQKRENCLDLADWDVVLSPGDPVLETHIPAGGNMTPESCRDSMAQALEFFPRIFPDKPFVGFACGSWILNPELDRIYRPDSNMVLWQRELYLFPIPTGSRAGIYFVFGREDVDPATAPRDTSLRRALLDHLSKGGRLIGGAMFMLLEEFPHFGTQVYRRQWEEFKGMGLVP